MATDTHLAALLTPEPGDFILPAVLADLSEIPDLVENVTTGWPDPDTTLPPTGEDEPEPAAGDPQ